MSAEEVSKGIEFIEATAKRFDLSLGSRHEDFSNRSIRLSLEKTIELGARRLLRSPVVELSRSFVQDLPSERKYKKALETFLHSLSLRLRHPKPNQFFTLSGIPFKVEIRWPFRQVQTADAFFDDYFVQVFVRIASPRPKEANLTVFISGDEQIQVGPSLSPPMTECLVINSVRVAIDEGRAKVYTSGTHPTVLQQVRVAPPAPSQADADDAKVRRFISKKTYWLGFREGDDKTLISFSDPYDSSYLARSRQSLTQMARILSAESSIRLDPSGQYACVSDGLLAQSAAYERDLADILEASQPIPQPDDAAPTSGPPSERTVFISYNTDDAPFATALANHLRTRRIRPWIDQEEIRVGDSLIGRIGKALHDNDFIVAVLSPSSVRSEWVRRELNEALTREIRDRRVVVLPVIARKCTIPAFLADKRYADFTKNYDVALDALVRTIQQPTPPLHS